MLTSNLVRFRKKGTQIKPRYLDARARERLLPVAETLLATFEQAVGCAQSELDQAIREIPHEARDRITVAGLVKLCEDLTELERPAGLEPTQVRETLFRLAAAAHRLVSGSAPFERGAVLASAAAELETTAEELETALYSDLKDAQRVTHFASLPARDLLARYDLSLAQSALLRATRLSVRFRDDDARRVREVFRAARFHGLIHTLREIGDEYELVVDGPYSIFESVQKYGLRLALFFPSLLTLTHYDILAEVLVGAARTPAELRIGPEDGLLAPRELPSGLRPEVEQLLTSFSALQSNWSIRRNDRVLALPGQRAIVPDLSFVSETTGEEVFLEAFGFWSRNAVFDRIAQIESGLGARLLVAVGKKARVSREALDESTGSSVIVFGSNISAREVLTRLEQTGDADKQ